MNSLEGLKAKILKAVAQASALAELEDIRVSALGKKGSVTGLLKDLGGKAPEERRDFGQAINAVKDSVTAAIDARKADLERAELDRRLATEKVDVTLPIRPETQGRIHPISQTMDEIIAIFGQMGFAVAEGPEIEDDFHNFTALNIPPEHPARQMHDTFYFRERDGEDRYLLRTHTSPVQIRTMKSTTPPIRIIAPGRTYRCDSDMTHTPMFHQVEGLIIDKSTHFGHLKGCLVEFFEAFFEGEVPVRLRPSFFPFTEPSAEVDIGCSRKGGELKIGPGGDWLEVLGCGMVHPNVLTSCGIDPEEYQGFAFGVGVERLAMLKYGIPDLRTFFDADLRWLKHYGFAPGDVPTLTGGLTR